MVQHIEQLPLSVTDTSPFSEERISAYSFYFDHSPEVASHLSNNLVDLQLIAASSIRLQAMPNSSNQYPYIARSVNVIAEPGSSDYIEAGKALIAAHNKHFETLAFDEDLADFGDEAVTYTADRIYRNKLSLLGGIAVFQSESSGKTAAALFFSQAAELNVGAAAHHLKASLETWPNSIKATASQRNTVKKLYISDHDLNKSTLRQVDSGIIIEHSSYGKELMQHLGISLEQALAVAA
jgi:hypothetical protein